MMKINPLTFKLNTTIDGYFYYGLSPILVYYSSFDIKIMGLFFLIESIVKFFGYGLAGTIANLLPGRKLLIVSQLLRSFAGISAISLFTFFKNDHILYFLLGCNLLFVIANLLMTTTFEMVLQKSDDYTSKTQGLISSGDMLAGAIAILSLILISVFKVNLIYCIFLIMIFCGISVRSIMKNSKNVMNYSNFNIVSNNYLFKRIFHDLIDSLKFFFKDKDLIQNTILGYIPFCFFIIFEQINIVDFAKNYDDQKMRIFHFSIKFCLFLLSGLIISPVMKKVKDLNTLLLISAILMLLGGGLSILRFSIVFDIIGIMFLGFSHTLILNYRKVKRRNIMIAKNITFSTLGFIFAIEGLSGVISNTYLAIFGKDLQLLFYLLLLGFFYMCFNFYLEKKISAFNNLP